ncbi:MAG: hypothetical protein PSX36_00215 [bacterium]|nr:hypothetical protein [bacterium]
MSKPWVGFVAVGFLFLAGVFEWIAGNPILAVFLAVMSIVSLVLRIYIIKKLKEHGEK